MYGNNRSLQFNLMSMQLCNGIDESTTGGCAQLIFAPIDESFGDDAPLLPSGFRVIPLEPKSVGCCFLILNFWLNSTNFLLIYFSFFFYDTGWPCGNTDTGLGFGS